jgi:hypothetical protein
VKPNNLCADREFQIAKLRTPVTIIRRCAEMRASHSSNIPRTKTQYKLDLFFNDPSSDTYFTVIVYTMLNVYTPTTRIAATHVVDILEGDLTQAVVACELRILSFVDRGAYACRSSVVLGMQSGRSCIGCSIIGAVRHYLGRWNRTSGDMNMTRAQRLRLNRADYIDPPSTRPEFVPVEDAMKLFDAAVRPRLRTLRNDMLRRGLAVRHGRRVVTTPGWIATFQEQIEAQKCQKVISGLPLGRTSGHSSANVKDAVNIGSRAAPSRSANRRALLPSSELNSALQATQQLLAKKKSTR